GPPARDPQPPDPDPTPASTRHGRHPQRCHPRERTRRRGRRGQDVSAIPTGRTDGQTPQGRKPAPTAPPHPPRHTGHTRAPRLHRHTRHTRQAGQAHASAGRLARHADTDARRGQDVCATDPRPAGRMDGQTPSASTGHCRRPQRRRPREHTRRRGRRGQESLPSPRDGWTDGLHKVGSLRRPHRCTHHSTQDTRGPRARTGTHGTHGRQARHTHPRDAAPATQTRTPAAVKMFTRRGQDVCANDPRPGGRTDARHQV
ncbi:mCG1032950, partial [Mus musculus]